ncbi:MAG TPA: fumarylacetoacetate hydrolase family protein [Bacteroidales bacterium]|nr:MAG: Homoprotocatechuate catabolism bifunctional isomerase/decarboxylase [Bacteroidetes bacterium ADurb.Bin090]HOD27468.1 fumarylacetoacetate hydrolase family protein [Bacteroidales bacterium]HPN47131.1 fumarylacetoacetate hydrolase family protein [Bacteroidales bacterium]HQM93686.1 fumarylacetoacetate hydrolase family protein [Bacteroidales bacterium]
MKIVAVGMNYLPHIQELKSEIPEEPVLFIKPDSALCSDKQPFFLPDFSQEIHYEVELVVKISRLGKNIAEKFAHRYYDEITLGLDLTARDLQRNLRARGLPWEISKGFDQSAVVGHFIPKNRFENIQQLHFRLDLNGKTVQQDSTAEMLFGVDRIIAYASRFFTLKTGDLFFTGTPCGVGPVHKEDHLEAWLEGEKMLHLRVK